ncbi:hypothetical protein DY000_02049342 [Brassica cretica]|uniref:Uncharacterized protein n=1 Tax=Brassica cretica TaxID=69181 RepID=A0ABQ7EY29_BRACR|nr:hypothetical protein DY000_02049342 [Brassica cretica]
MNLKASVFLLEPLLQDGKYDFQKLSSRATLTISQTMKSFLIKNNEGITTGGANGNLYEKAEKSCKVILGRLSPGNCSSLRGACITDVESV